MPQLAVEDKCQLNSVEQTAYETTVLNGIYQDLNRIASYQISREPTGYLWSPSDLINEAYLRLLRAYGKNWALRPTPAALWSRVMMRVLIDRSRAHRAQKRCWGIQEPFDPNLRVAHSSNIENRIAVRTAVKRVKRSDRRKGTALTLTAFAGFTIEETASAMHVNPRTVKRLLHSGRCELRKQLQSPEARHRLPIAA